LLAAFHVIEETGVDKYKTTPFSLAIGDDSKKIHQSLQSG
jgi:fumagillin biosynthesis methyltransferase